MSEVSRGPDGQEVVTDSESISYLTPNSDFSPSFDDDDLPTECISPSFRASSPLEDTTTPTRQRGNRQEVDADATFESTTVGEVESDGESGRFTPEMGQLFSRAARKRARSQSASNDVICGLSNDSVNCVGIDALALSTFDPEGQAEDGTEPEFRIPIVGYEINEERSRFTIFKVRVEHPSSGRRWFVFRRYTDFARLNRKLKTLFPGLRFSIPPKKWFGDNFDTAFLEDRLNGLQAFVNSLMMNEEVKKSQPVREFFCLDDPPGPEDGFEESRAFCESLEETIVDMQRLGREKDKEVELLKGEVSMLKTQMKMLVKSLRMECSITSTVLNRLQKAQELNASRESICSSEVSGCRYTNLHHIIRDHSFNVTFLEIMEKSMGSLGLSNSTSSLGSIVESCNANEERADNCSTSNNSTHNQTSTLPVVVKIPVTVHATMVENISRSTGDGSTGSSERLPPVGGVSESQRVAEFPHSFGGKMVEDLNNSVPEIHPSSLQLKSVIDEKILVNSNTSMKSPLDNAIVHNGVTNITLEA